MQPIKVTYANMVGTWLVLSAFAYAIPSDIMSYEWANSFVDTTAHLIPAIDKLKQAYAQNLVTGASLFIHTCQWPLFILILLLMIKPKFQFVGKELKWLTEGAKWRLALCLLICFGGWWIRFNDSFIDNMLEGGHPTKIFRLTHEIEIVMVLYILAYAGSLILAKHLAIHLSSRS